MNTRRTAAVAAAFMLAAIALDTQGGTGSMATVKLPAPALKSAVSVEEAIQRRRSRRQFTSEPLSLAQIGQVLWSAQGITGAGGRKRAAPSAGATYPMELFVAVGPGTVQGLEAGVYHYLPEGHNLEKVLDGDIRSHVAAAALGQEVLADAPADILMAAVYERTARRYGRERSFRYVAMEAGHIGQNIYLQCESLGLGTVAVGAFRDDEVATVFRLGDGLAPLYLMPVGHPR